VGTEEKIERFTFLSKKAIVCPACEKEFRKEDLLTGGGRLIAGDLDEDLRRRYQPSKRYGTIYPLVYPVAVCPHCWYAVYPGDIAAAPRGDLERIRGEEDMRRENVALILDDVDFTRSRTLQDGAASYLLALLCYEHADARVTPTFKRGLSALRCAWCLNDLHAAHPGESYDKVARIMYEKALFFYRRSLDTMHSRREDLEALKSFGPDLDNNYGFDGFLYLNGQLEFRYGPTEDREKRIQALENARRAVAKIFGMGRASKGKPSAILDLARSLHDQMGEQIKKLEG